MTDGGKYLAHILIKGLRGDYKPVISWLSLLHNSASHFSNLLKEEDQNAIMLLNALKGGMYSKSKEVCVETLKLFSKISYNFSSASFMENARKWFVQGEGGLEGTVFALKKYSDVSDDVAILIVNIGKGQLQELFQTYLKSLIPQQDAYWRLLTSFLKPLQSAPFSEEIKQEIGTLLESWLDIGCRQAENDGRHTVDERAASLGFLCEMWLLFPEQCEAKEEIANYILTVLIRATRDKNLSLQYFSLALLFELLDNFAEQKRPFAPTIYKALTFSVVELYQLDHIRCFIEENFSLIFKKNPTIPIGILIDPLVKQIQIGDSDKSEFNIFDFQFFYLLTSHPKLISKNALQLLDILAQVLLNDVMNFPLALQAFISIFAKLLTEDNIREFGDKFIKLAFSTLLTNVKAKSKKKDSKKQVQVSNAEPSVQALQNQEIITLLIEMQDLEDDELNENIQSLALNTNFRIKVIIKKNYELLKPLLKRYGSFESQIKQFENEQEKPIVEEKEENKNPPLLAIEAPKQDLPKIKSVAFLELDKKSDPLLTIKEVKEVNSSKEKNNYQLVPFSPNNNDVDKKALLALERIKKNRTDRDLKVITPPF